MKLRESVNVRELEWVIQNLDTVIKEERVKFQSYYMSLRNGEAMVRYKKSSGHHGRLYAAGALSLQGFSVGLRNKLAGGIYQDIDMENCHPVFLLQLCERNGWDAPELRNYVENREQVLRMIHPNRLQSKTIMLKLMYGGEVTVNHPIIDRFKKEISRLARLIFSKYPIGHPKMDNPLYSRMSLVLQDIENTVLMEMVSFFKSARYEPGVLMFDGLMVYRQDRPLPLRECEYFIEQRTGWKVTLVEKN